MSDFQSVPHAGWHGITGGDWRGLDGLVSYGNYAGPHDGSSLTETGFDQLQSVPDRAIVISAGNGFGAQCHANGRVTKSEPARLEWRIPSCDESMNIMEVL